MIDVIEKRGISQAAAEAAIAAATARAAELGNPSTIAVVDESGMLKAYARMDGAVVAGVEFAPAKARLSASLGLSTSLLRSMVREDPSMAPSLIIIPGTALLGGGLPILVGGAIVGAVGVSGAAGEAQDDAIAQFGVDAALAV